MVYIQLVPKNHLLPWIDGLHLKTINYHGLMVHIQLVPKNHQLAWIDGLQSISNGQPSITMD